MSTSLPARIIAAATPVFRRNERILRLISNVYAQVGRFQRKVDTSFCRCYSGTSARPRLPRSVNGYDSPRREFARASGFFLFTPLGERRPTGARGKGETLSELIDRVQRFIAENISSVTQLEVLLLLKGHPEQSWNADEVARALYAGPTLLADELAAWLSRGLLEVEPDRPEAYRYAPRTQELAALVDALEEAYKSRRVSVITAIYSKPTDKIRTFADAFRIRKEP